MVAASGSQDGPPRAEPVADVTAPTLIDGAHAGITSRLDAIEQALEADQDADAESGSCSFGTRLADAAPGRATLARLKRSSDAA